MPSNDRQLGLLRLHFRTLDTGSRHTSASKASVDVLPQQPFTSEWYLQQSNICDRYIGVMLMDDFEDGQVEFWIIDWKSGKVMLVSIYHSSSGANPC